MTEKKAGIVFAIPLALLLGLAAMALLVLPGFTGIPRMVKAVAPVPAATAHDHDRVFLRAIVAPPDADAEIVILQQAGGKLMVPLFVTKSEGESIRRAQEGEHGKDLLANTVSELGGTIEGVILDEKPSPESFSDPLANDVGASLILRGKDRKEVHVHAAAAEAVQAAVSAGSPIFVTQEVLASDGLTLQDLEKIAKAARQDDDSGASGDHVSM